MPYNTSIPATGHTPAEDYTEIQTNFAQIQTSFSVDHVPLANGTNEGNHEQVTMPVRSDPSAPTSKGILYTKTVNSRSELFYRGDGTGVVPISCVRAFGEFDGTTGTLSNSFNATVMRNAIGKYTVTFITNMPDANYGVLLSASGVATVSEFYTANYRNNGTTSFDIEARRFAGNAIAFDPTSISFVVIKN